MINKRTYLGIPLLCRRNRRWLVMAYWASVLLIFLLISIWCYQRSLAAIRVMHWWEGPLFGIIFGSLLTWWEPDIEDAQ